MCTVVYVQNLKVVLNLKQFFEEELVTVENVKWKCPHTYYNNAKPSHEGFIILLIHFLVFWLLIVF